MTLIQDAANVSYWLLLCSLGERYPNDPVVSQFAFGFVGSLNGLSVMIVVVHRSRLAVLISLETGAKAAKET